MIEHRHAFLGLLLELDVERETQGTAAAGFAKRVSRAGRDPRHHARQHRMLVISHDQSSGTRQITKQLTVAVRVRLKPIDFRQVTVDPQLHHIDTRQADVDLLKQQWAQTFHAGQHIDSSHSRGQTANPYPRGVTEAHQ